MMSMDRSIEFCSSVVSEVVGKTVIMYAKENSSSQLQLLLPNCVHKKPPIIKKLKKCIPYNVLSIRVIDCKTHSARYYPDYAVSYIVFEKMNDLV